MDKLLVYLEKLRGRKYPTVCAEEEIPCIETSDPEKLCNHPLVSVLMVTYNHAKYIRQAIESVMMQQTDFDYELIIGEDASSDGTREICFEMQKKYPEKIRVLWSEQNLYAINGNMLRVNSHVRGEYVAFLEGDDYWTDSNKIQKQIDLVKKTGAVGCVARRVDLLEDGKEDHPDADCNFDYLTNDVLFCHYFHTSTYLFRTDIWHGIKTKYKEITEWYDTQVVQCMAVEGKICFLPEEVSVYRRTGEGIATSQKTMYDRISLLLSQFIPMYLFGPQKIKLSYGVISMREIAHLGCPYISEYNSHRYSHIQKKVLSIFFRLLLENWKHFENWTYLIRLIFYRIRSIL